MWVTKLLISPVKKRIFFPKTTKFGPKLAFLVDMGLAMQVYLVPCWLVGWWLWRAGCISQDTYLLYYNLFQFLSFHVKDVYFGFLANKPVFDSIQLWFFSQALFRILNDSISESGKNKRVGLFFSHARLFFFLSLIVIMAFNRFCRIPSFLGL